jgi:hypothetical protein
MEVECRLVPWPQVADDLLAKAADLDPRPIVAHSVEVGQPAPRDL